MIFSQGFAGAALFVMFFVLAFSRCWRCRTTNETLCTFVLAFFGLQIFVYDTLGEPLLAVMTAVGLVAREQLVTARQRSSQLMEPALARLRAWWPILAALMLLGALAGMALAATRPPIYATRVSILLAEPPVYLDTTRRAATEDAPLPGDVTIDTEAALVISRQSLTRVVGSGETARLDELRRRVHITAAPNTTVLTIEVRGRDAASSRKQAVALARSYLLTRRAYLSNRRDQTLAILREQLAQLHGRASKTVVVDSSGQAGDPTRRRLEEAVAEILLTPTTAGEVIRISETVRVKGRSAVPATTGAALGLAVGAVLMAALPGWRPRIRRRREPE